MKTSLLVDVNGVRRSAILLSRISKKRTPTIGIPQDTMDSNGLALHLHHCARP